MDRPILDAARADPRVWQHRAHRGHAADLRCACRPCRAGRVQRRRRVRCRDRGADPAGTVQRIRRGSGAAGELRHDRPPAACFPAVERAAQHPLVPEPGGQRVGGGDHVGCEPRRGRRRSGRPTRYLRRPSRDLDPRSVAARPRRQRRPGRRCAARTLHGGERRLPPGAAGRGGGEHILRCAPVQRRDHRCHGAHPGRQLFRRGATACRRAPPGGPQPLRRPENRPHLKPLGGAWLGVPLPRTRVHRRAGATGRARRPAGDRSRHW